MKWLEPWQLVRNVMDEAYSLAWEAELALETSPDHPLYGTKATLIARRFDCDDALYQLEDGRVAIVQLTWSQHQERGGQWPDTRTYCSLEAWEKMDLQPTTPNGFLAEAEAQI